AQTGMILPQAIMHLLEPLVSASDSLPAILLSSAQVVPLMYVTSTPSKSSSEGTVNPLCSSSLWTLIIDHTLVLTERAVPSSRRPPKLSVLKSSQAE
ncbi:hypothetical protein FK514_27325, partial [Klebsiella pneumoniae]|uniref:hypothetical protein n=1 Tax=Klebsiella pneumoniae TaxID=573 RepID=UPI00210DD285